MDGSPFAGNMMFVGSGVGRMALKQSVIIGPFSVDAEGRLSPTRPDVSPGFSVRWRGRVVHARLMRGNTGGGTLHICASLGRVPSTASGPDARIACYTIVRNALRALPKAWSARLLPDHRSQLEVETTVSLPITVTNLVTELTMYLLTLSPYMDLVDRAGLELARVASRPPPAA